MVDTHAHLNMEPLSAEVARHIAEAKAAGVSAIVVPAVNLESSASSMALAVEYPGCVYGCVGIHPSDAASATLADFERMYAEAEWESVTAVGEVGYDFHHELPGLDDTARESLQRDVFEQAIGWATKMGKPLIIHTRDAFAPTYETLRARAAGHPTVIHCFTGSADELSAWLELGCHVSATCLVTYPKNAALAAIIATIPDDRLMVETDAPFLAPQGKRGEVCTPMDVYAGARHLAQLKEMTIEAFDMQTTNVARSFFSL